jgi:hypothetical protein
MRCNAITKTGLQCKRAAKNGDCCPLHSKQKTNTPKPTKPKKQMYRQIDDIERYTQSFTEYPAELTDFCTTNNISLPGIESASGQALALLSQPENRGKRYVGGREDASKFFTQIGIVTAQNDPIQFFNKFPQRGLKLAKLKRAQYSLPFPFEADMTHVNKRKNATIGGDRNQHIDAIKDYWRVNLVDVPNEEWQVGHLNPEIEDSSEENLAYQPPIQARYRDRFIWDRMFQLMYPTTRELVDHPDKYYTEEGQRQIAIAFARRCGLQLVDPQSAYTLH